MYIHRAKHTCTCLRTHLCTCTHIARYLPCLHVFVMGFGTKQCLLVYIVAFGFLPDKQSHPENWLGRGTMHSPYRYYKYPLAVRTMVVHIIYIHWGHMRRRCTGGYGPFPPSSYGLTLIQLSTIKLWIIHKWLHTGMHLHWYNQHTTPCMKAVRVQINQW